MSLWKWMLILSSVAAPAFGADGVFAAGMMARYRPSTGPTLLVAVQATANAKNLAYVEPQGGSAHLPAAHWTSQKRLTVATATSLQGLLRQGGRNYLVEISYETKGAYFVKILGSNPRKYVDHWVGASSVTLVDAAPSVPAGP